MEFNVSGFVDTTQDWIGKLSPTELEEARDIWAEEASTLLGPTSDSPYFGITLLGPNWALAHEGNWVSWIAASAQCTATSIIEVGAFEGASTVSLLDKAASWVKNYIVIDVGRAAVGPWGRERFIQLHNNVSAKVDLIEGTSAIAFPLVYAHFHETQDAARVIYVDGSHHADDVFLDLEYAFRTLAEHGIIIIDDYDNGLHPEDNEHACSSLSPRRGVHAFLALHGDELQQLDYCTDVRTQFCVRKVRSTAPLIGSVTRPLNMAATHAVVNSTRTPAFPLPCILTVDRTPYEIVAHKDAAMTLRLVPGLALETLGHGIEVGAGTFNAIHSAFDTDDRRDSFQGFIGTMAASRDALANAADAVMGLAKWFVR